MIEANSSSSALACEILGIEIRRCAASRLQPQSTREAKEITGLDATVLQQTWPQRKCQTNRWRYGDRRFYTPRCTATYLLRCMASTCPCRHGQNPSLPCHMHTMPVLCKQHHSKSSNITKPGKSEKTPSCLLRHHPNAAYVNYDIR